jgi:putative membrane protein
MIINFETHASNERTFLSWVRTAVAIVGFGLAAARLGNQHSPFWSELLMLVAGAAVVLIAWARMRHVRRRIDRPDRLPDDGAPAELFLMLLIIALFTLLGTFAIHVS